MTNYSFLLLALLSALLLQATAAGAEKIRIIMDTDALAEVDDQHAIAYMLFSGDHFEVEGITVNRGSDGPHRTDRDQDINDHFREAVNVVKMCGSNVPVLKGPAGNYRQLKGDMEKWAFDGSDAVHFIIERAHTPSDRPLIIYACGNLTNVALALLKDPTIAPEIEIWWLGTEWPKNYACNNHVGDLDAVDALLANPQNVAFNIMPWPHEIWTNHAEIYEKMPGKGPKVSPGVPGRWGGSFTRFGDYSVELFRRGVWSGQKRRSLLDAFGFAVLKNKSWFTPTIMGAPSFKRTDPSAEEKHKYPGEWVANESNPRKVTFWRHGQMSAVMADFWDTFNNPVLPRQRPVDSDGGQEHQPPAPAEARNNKGVVPLAADKPGSGGEAEVFALWDEQAPWPSLDKRKRPEGAVDVLVHRATEEYQFLHENAVVWHGNTLFAAWYNCPRYEISGSASVRGRRSRDGGKTWSEVEVIAADNEGKGVFYVPVALFSHEGTLYAYITTMVGHDLVVNCEVFVLDEATDQWESRGVIADMFQPHCTPVLMEDGNYIMAGRASLSPGTIGEWPAVAISNGTNFTDPWTVVRLTEDRLRRFPEPTVWVDGKNITAISRSNPDQPPQPSSNVGGRVFTSSDYGRNWHGPILHNLPELANSKLYAGVLSSGQRYLVWTTPSGGYRNELVIAVSRPGEKQLAAVWQLQHGRSEELGVGPEWSYPYAVEHDGKLYVIYTSQKRHSMMTIIPVTSLELTPADDWSP